MPSSSPAPDHKLTQDGPCGRILEVNLPAADVLAAESEVARKLARSVELPGFRKGRVPAAVVRGRFGAEIEKETVESLADRHVPELLATLEARPVAQPVLEEHRREDSGSLHLRIRYEEHEDFELGDYRGLKATRPTVKVGDEDVERTLNTLRQRLSRTQPVEGRPAAGGDEVVVDLAGSHVEGPDAGETFSNSQVRLVLGTDDVHPELSQVLEGSKSGEEKRVRIRYEDGYRTDALAGRLIDYVLKVHRVEERLLPDLDDDLARRAGSFESLSQMRDRVREDLTAQANSEADGAVRDALVRQLLEKHSFAVPEVLVETETRYRLEHLARSLAGQGVDPSQAGIDWKAEAERVRGQARGDIRVGRILDAIARKEGLEADATELEERLAHEAKSAGVRPEALRARWEKEGQMDALRRQLVRRSVLDFLRDVGHIQEQGDQP